MNIYLSNIYILFFRNIFMSVKAEKPTLTGARIKQRKRGMHDMFFSRLHDSHRIFVILPWRELMFFNSIS